MGKATLARSGTHQRREVVNGSDSDEEVHGDGQAHMAIAAMDHASEFKEAR